MRSCWMCLNTPHPTIKAQMIVYNLSFQPLARLAPPLVVLNNTSGGRGYDSAIKRWILGDVSTCFNERNAPGNFRNIVHQDNGLPTISVIWLFCIGAAVRPDNPDIFTLVNLIVSPLLAVNTSHFRNWIWTRTVRRKVQTPCDFF